MPSNILADLIIANITPTPGSKVSATALRAVLNALNNYVQQDIAFTTSVPFTSLSTRMTPHPIIGATVFSPNIANAIPNAETYVRLIANGTNVPTFTGFKKIAGSQDWINTNGTLNGVLFRFDGTDYWYGLLQEASIGGVAPDAPTSGVVDDTADTFNWTNNPSFTSVGQYEQTLDGGTTITTATAKPISVGNVAKAIGQVGIRVKAVGGNPASAWLFNASAFNVAGGGGDTTPPTITGATISNPDTDRIVLATSESLPSMSLDASKFTVTKNGSPVTLPSAAQNGGVTLFLPSPAISTDVFTVAYAAGSSGARIQDTAGNFAASITSPISVTNSIPIVPAGTALIFASPLTQASGVWVGAGGGYDADKAIADKVFPQGAEAIIFAQYQADSPEHFFGLQEAGTAQPYGLLGVAAFVTAGGILYSHDFSGTPSLASTGYTMPAGTFYGVRQTSAGKFRVFVSTDMVTIVDKTGDLVWLPSTGVDLSIQANMGSTSAHLRLPKGTGVI